MFGGKKKSKVLSNPNNFFNDRLPNVSTFGSRFSASTDISADKIGKRDSQGQVSAQPELIYVASTSSAPRETVNKLDASLI